MPMQHVSSCDTASGSRGAAFVRPLVRHSSPAYNGPTRVAWVGSPTQTASAL